MKIAVAHPNIESQKLITYLLCDLGHQVLWTSDSGKDVISYCQSNPPALLLISLELTDTPCIDVIRHVMQHTPTTIIVISQSVQDHPARVFEAMSAGALDAFTEPSTTNPQSIQDIKRKISNIVKLHKSVRNNPVPEKSQIEQGLVLVAIGASTGGPAALVKVLSALPTKPDAVIVMIQHMDKQFSEGMAKWIGEQTHVKVEIAQPNQKPVAGTAYIAAGEDHLILNKQGCFEYTPEPIDYPYRPSVDVFFESAVACWPNRMIGVLLTGMGRDGANGLLTFYNRNMLTIAQNEESCAVFGMPKAAIALQAAKKVLHIDEIGPAIRDALKHA